MERNYNFKRNPEEPSSEDIRQRMDFDALLQEFEAQPAAKANGGARIRRLAYLSTAVAAAVALLLLVPFLSGNKPLSPEAYFAQQDFVHIPLPQQDLQVPYTTEAVADAHKGGVIDYPSGSRLVIPAAAFMNDRGRLVGGEVAIHYRELHDYIDFFVSGIPLAYDSVGMQRYLTSAGMVEVYAEQNGKRLKMAPGKAIQVELRSEVVVKDYFSLPKYHVYQLDTASRTWQYRNVDMLQFVEEDLISGGTNTPQQRWQRELGNLEEEYDKALQDLQMDYPLPSAPVAPTQANGNRPTLELDFTQGALALDPESDLQPEDLAYLHAGTIWEIAPESPAVDPRAFRVSWETVKLRRLNAQRFELTLQHRDNQETLIVAPVLLGANYQKALAKYQQELAAYDAMVTLREEQVGSERERLQIQFSERREALKERLEQEFQSQPGELRRQVVNRFVVSEFGVWNCAQPIDAPSTVQGVQYRTKEGQTIENMTAYVVNREYNTVFRYLASSTAPIGIEPASDNLLWVVDERGEISRIELKQLYDDGAELVLEKVTPPVKSRADLRKALEF